MVRFVLAGAVCLFAFHDALAAKPAANAQPHSTAVGRKQIEAILRSPADLDFYERRSTTVGGLLDMLHERHHLSIRFDIPTLSNLYGLDPSGNASKGVADEHSAPHLTYYPLLKSGRDVGTSPPGAAQTKPANPPGAHTTTATANAKPAAADPTASYPNTGFPPPTLPPLSDGTVPSPSVESDQQLADKLRSALGDGQLHHYSIDVKVMGGTCWLSGSVHDPEELATALKIASETQGVKTVISELKLDTAKPLAAEKPSETPAHFLERAEKIEVSIATVDERTITVATALRLAIDAFPSSDANISDGLPLSITDASHIDFLVEDDCILVTTRAKALTDKETRVYSLRNLKDASPLELSEVIRQSVRPWSWRSRIDELGGQLRSGVEAVPPAAIVSIAKSVAQLASDAAGIPLAVSEKSETDSPKGAEATDAKRGLSNDAQQAAMIGHALAAGIVVLANTSLSTLEVIHYADPPTGSIRMLPGKLIITQSQAAHREIAELLKQLSDE